MAFSTPRATDGYSLRGPSESRATDRDGLRGLFESRATGGYSLRAFGWLDGRKEAIIKPKLEPFHGFRVGFNGFRGFRSVFVLLDYGGFEWRGRFLPGIEGLERRGHNPI